MFCLVMGVGRLMMMGFHSQTQFIQVKDMFITNLKIMEELQIVKAKDK